MANQKPANPKTARISGKEINTGGSIPPTGGKHPIGGGGVPAGSDKTPPTPKAASTKTVKGK